jgi:hypothetical protein
VAEDWKSILHSTQAQATKKDITDEERAKRMDPSVSRRLASIVTLQKKLGVDTTGMRETVIEEALKLRPGQQMGFQQFSMSPLAYTRPPENVAVAGDAGGHLLDRMLRKVLPFLYYEWDPAQQDFVDKKTRIPRGKYEDQNQQGGAR